MATITDPSPMAPAEAAAPAAFGPNGNGRRIALLVLAALLACSLGAWLGYRHAFEPAAPAGSAASRAVPPPPVAAPFGADLGLGDNEMIISEPPAAAASALAWPMWEFRLRQPIPPREPSLTPPTWRLIGSSLTGGKWSVIVLRQGSTTPEYFSVGDELPGGYRIESINDEDVTLAKGKRVMVLSYIGSR